MRGHEHMNTSAEWHERLREQREVTRPFYLHWRGQSPASWLSRESRAALDERLTRVGTNFPRLVVTTMVDRLRLRGFRPTPGAPLDDALWSTFVHAGGTVADSRVHTDYGLYGASFATISLTDDGMPCVMADSPRTAAATVEAGTGRTVEAARTWHGVDKYQRMAVMTADGITTYKAGNVGPLDEVTRWNVEHEHENVLGVVPCVPFLRRQSSDDTLGTSMIADILDLTDANSKALGDAMVTSEMFAKPRRWVTGLELQFDDDDNLIDPFGSKRLMQSEDPETKFGQLAASTPTGQTELVAVLTQQIGALTGLPPHYLGLHGDQPTSAEAVRAAESQLVSRAQQEQDTLSPSWARVAAYVAALERMEPVGAVTVRTEWRAPETKTPAQSADAAQKLRAIGIPLESLLSDPLDYAPEDVAKITAAADRESIVKALADGTA